MIRFTFSRLSSLFMLLLACSVIACSTKPAIGRKTTTTATPTTSSGVNTNPTVAPTELQSNGGILETPPMGWSDYNAFGNNGYEELIKSIADIVATNGMKDNGYKYINIDDGWQGGRDSQGNIQANGNYPDGIKALADYVHKKGLKFGIYTTPAKSSCNGKTGSEGHYAQDVRTFASWGVDYIKLDWCGYDASPRGAAGVVEQWQNAIKASGSQIMLSINAGGDSSVSKWAKSYPPIMWRTGNDICASWFNKTPPHNDAAKDCFTTQYQNGIYDYLVSPIGDNMLNVGPGHYADPDMLEVGNPGLSFEEAKTHFSMWAMWSAPLIAGNDLRNMNEGGYDARNILLNKEVIAIDQDPAVSMAEKVQDDGGLQIWVKKLQATGARAVALVNTTGNAMCMTVSANLIGFTNITGIRDLWLHQDITPVGDVYTVSVPVHGVVLLKIAGK